MRLLLSNDDGCQSAGLAVLAEACRPFGEIFVAAPDRDRSGASNSLTLDRPLSVEQDARGFHCINGTPTDCVHLALTCLLDDPPDMVISGINHGANLGDDVLYSGTVAAAMEGRFLGRPAMAVSLASRTPRHLDTAGRVVALLVERLRTSPLPELTLLNVNVPDLPFDRLAGFRVTRLGHRHPSEAVTRLQDPHGRTVYWIGGVGDARDAGEGTDFHAVAEGFVSLTPLTVDMTRHSAVGPLCDWVRALEELA